MDGMWVGCCVRGERRKWLEGVGWAVSTRLNKTGRREAKGAVKLRDVRGKWGPLPPLCLKSGSWEAYHQSGCRSARQAWLWPTSKSNIDEPTTKAAPRRPLAYCSSKQPLPEPGSDFDFQLVASRGALRSPRPAWLPIALSIAACLFYFFVVHDVVLNSTVVAPYRTTPGRGDVITPCDAHH